MAVGFRIMLGGQTEGSMWMEVSRLGGDVKKEVDIVGDRCGEARKHSQLV